MANPGSWSGGSGRGPVVDSRSGVAKIEENLANFQAITGLDDPELSIGIITLSPVIRTSSFRGLNPKQDLVEAHVVYGDTGLITGALGLGARIAGGVLSSTIVLLGLAPPSRPDGGASSPIPPGLIPILRSLWDLKSDKKRKLFQNFVMVHQYSLQWHSQEVSTP
ncbi:unnamed protein product [Spirodela intermedia]|uniref:Uncharacterized protein n=1 Tax=Spirodela intermedia TaxID=51605 RepID=A0A7I8IZN3_SPIIN|nr:unnamed protein product [Spirodela intermedia]CAA6663348.1 unnamed protein product [Spirodela intermedia]